MTEQTDDRYYGTAKVSKEAQAKFDKIAAEARKAREK